MKTPKIIHQRRAVSPILAAILLIGLAVSAGAVLFVVVLPLISNPGGSLVFDESTTTLSATNMHLVLKNEGTETASIDNIVVSSGGVEANFTYVDFSINKGQGAVKDYSFVETLTPGTWTITVTFDLGDVTGQTISIDLTVA
jgi:flagellin-like protein